MTHPNTQSSKRLTFDICNIVGLAGQFSRTDFGSSSDLIFLSLFIRFDNITAFDVYRPANKLVITISQMEKTRNRLLEAIESQSVQQVTLVLFLLSSGRHAPTFSSIKIYPQTNLKNNKIYSNLSVRVYVILSTFV